MKHAHDRTHLGALGGLRGLAALAVFGVHFNQIVGLDARVGPFDLYTLLANGRYAVSLFFSLSGFLLGLPFWRAMFGGASMPGLRGFAARRAARILPAYFVALGVLVIPSGLWRLPAARIDILLHVTFLFNATEFSVFSINPPFWTLAVEVQFYLLLPFILAWVRRMTPRGALLVFLLLGLGSYVAHVRLVQAVSRVIPWPGNPMLDWLRPGGAVVSHSLLAHLPHFLLGVASGRLFLVLREREHRHAGRVRRASEAVFWCCLAATLVLLGTRFVNAVAVPHGRYGLPLVPLLLTVLIVSAPLTRVARNILDALPLRLLGAVSYGFYLYHLPCLHLTDRFMARRGIDASEHWVSLGLAAFGLSVLIAFASFIAVEKPIRALARRGNRCGQSRIRFWDGF